jgi:DNA-binding transcriptional LysR family regulator
VRLFADRVEERLPYWLVARPEALRQPAVAEFVRALRERMAEVEPQLLGIIGS